MKKTMIFFLLLFISVTLFGNCTKGLKGSIEPGGPKKKIVRQTDLGEWLLYGSNTQGYRSTGDYFELNFDKSPTWSYDGEPDGLHYVNKGSPVVYKNNLLIMTSYYQGDPPVPTGGEIIGMVELVTKLVTKLI